MSQLEAALWYAKKGIPVFPCREENKRPYTRNGFKNATTDETQIKRWWGRYPGAMIGMPTGPLSGYSAIDVGADPIPSELNLFIREHRKGSAKQRTPNGGFHQVYLHQDGVKNYGHIRNVDPDVDIRGDGGYIILPPSAMADGKAYKWVGPDLFHARAEFPFEFQNIVRSFKSKGGRNGRGRAVTPDEVEIGERYPVMRSLMTGMYYRGMEEAELLETAEKFNSELSEPLPPEQWARLVNYVTDWLPQIVQDSEESFWDSTDILRHIRRYAQSNRTAPTPVLGCVIARTAVATSPSVVLPGRGAGQSMGSLNTYVALVGEPGSGKDQAIGVGNICVEIGDDVELQMRLGSGEGLAHGFMRRATPKEREKGSPEYFWNQHSILFCDSEIETVLKMGGRQGATLLSELRAGWSGSTLGHLFSDPNKRLMIPAHEYRLCFVAGVQPAKAGVLLDDVGGGMPQRFLWLQVKDRFAPDEVVYNLESKALVRGFAEVKPGSDPVLMSVCKEAFNEIDSQSIRALRTGVAVDPMKTHRLQLKLRVAALLAVLHGEESVTIDWWRMADWVVSRSDEGLMVCRYFALQERMKEAKTRGRREGLVAAESSKVVEEEAGRSFSSAKRIVLNRLERADGRWVKAKELQVALGKPEYRKHEKEVVSDLLESGDIEKSRRRTPGKPGPAGLWYRRVMP